MARRANRARRPLDIMAPPIEQMRDGAFAEMDIVDRRPGGAQVTIGRAFRRRPQIDVLLEKRVIDDDQHKALHHYRHHADLADRSLIRDSLGKRQGGGCGSGDGPTIGTLNAMRVRDDCERAAGSLADLLRAVVVYDTPIQDCAAERFGGIEERETKHGKTYTRIRPRKESVDIVANEIRFAASRVQAELDA